MTGTPRPQSLSPTTASVLHLKGLRLSYGPVGYQLTVPDLVVAPRQLVLIYGGSGSGKSVLLDALTGQSEITGGEIWYGADDFSSLSEGGQAAFRLHNLGQIRRHHNLIDSLNVAENVAIVAQLQGLSYADALRNAGLHLQRVKCAQLADRFPKELTPLQGQKVTLARALSAQRQLLIADEPTGDLNGPDSQDFMELLCEQVVQGLTVILATSDLRLIPYADSIYQLSDGQLTEVVEISELYPQPGSTKDTGVAPGTETIADPDAGTGVTAPARPGEEA